MSGQLLTPGPDPEPAPDGAAPDGAAPDGANVRREPSVLGRVVSVIALGLVLGIVGGMVWEWLWTPPSGAAYQGRWMPDPQGAPMVVDATAWFVVVGLVQGLLYGTLVARLLRGREVLTMFTLFFGALLAAWVSQQVGQWLGPPDADALARTMGDLEPLVSNLELRDSSAGWWPSFLGSTARLVPAFGAMTAIVVVHLGTRPARPRRSSVSQETHDGP